jgi:hypothetical protein
MYLNVPGLMLFHLVGLNAVASGPKTVLSRWRA